MKNFILISIASILVTPIYSQVFQGSATPTLTAAIKESSEGFSQFLDLWEYSLKIDGKSPANRRDVEPKTLLLPGDASMAQLVPQDGAHPLFLGGSKFSQLRQEFILDHLVLESMPVEASDKGMRTTLSGKNIFIQRDVAGKLFVNGIRVKKTVSLADDYYIYVLEAPLFNQAEKVRQAFNDYHSIKADDPIGPPLDIPEGPFPPPIPTGSSVPRAPAPPPRIAQPPAPPTNHLKIGPPAPPS